MDLASVLKAPAGMHTSSMSLLLLMTIVWTTGVLCRLIKQPPVLGELIAGIIFGPAFLNIIQPSHMIEMLSELGVFFLMFYAGLETDPKELRSTGKDSTLVGVSGFIIPFAISYGTCMLFHIPSSQALFISLGLSITAIAVSARVLHDLRLDNKRVFSIIIGASIVDDVLALSFFTVIVDVSTSGGVINFANMFTLFMKVVLFFGITIAIGIWLYPKFRDYFASRESKGFTFAMMMALLFGTLAEYAGLHIIIGAYMAGLFVRDGVVSQGLLLKIKDRFVSITYGFLGPIFFVSLSFHVTFDIFSTHLPLLVVLTIAAVFGKMAGAFFAGKIGDMDRNESVITGLAMNGRGAVELIVASIGLKLGIINDTVFSILVFIAFITTILPPISLRFYLNKMKGELK